MVTRVLNQNTVLDNMQREMTSEELEEFNNVPKSNEYNNNKDVNNPLQLLRLNLNKLWKKRSVTITDYDPTYRVVYLGNVVTGWAKGDGCIDRPVSTLWRNYCQSSKTDVVMKLTVCSSGLKALTREHGLTEYWSHRITYCSAPPSQPRIFCWVYRHEGRKLKQELRCHAVLCPKASKARAMAATLQDRLARALYEFKREKLLRQNARLSLANCVYDNPSLPRRKILLSTGVQNYRPPLERSKSAPKLTSIEETLEENTSLEELEELDEEISVISESTSDLVADYDDTSCSSTGSVPESPTTTLLLSTFSNSPRPNGGVGVSDDGKDILSDNDDDDDDDSLSSDGDSRLCVTVIKEQDTLSDESGYSEDKTDTASSGSASSQ